jgi:hypothetical protein
LPAITPIALIAASRKASQGSPSGLSLYFNNGSVMRPVKINGVTYELDELSDEVKTHLKYLSFIDSEAERLTMQLNTLKLARDGVGKMLDIAMARHTLDPKSGDKPRGMEGASGSTG